MKVKTSNISFDSTKRCQSGWTMVSKYVLNYGLHACFTSVCLTCDPESVNLCSSVHGIYRQIMSELSCPPGTLLTQGSNPDLLRWHGLFCHCTPESFSPINTNGITTWKSIAFKKLNTLYHIIQ